MHSSGSLREIPLHAPGIPPMAVLCTSVVDLILFIKFMYIPCMHTHNRYKYEILGGQHSALARNAVALKHTDNMMLQKALAEVYVGLTDDEALRLSSRHNVNGSIN